MSLPVTKENVQDLITIMCKDRNITSNEIFRERYLVGMLASGNSIYDLMGMIFRSSDANIPFPLDSFDEIVNNLLEESNNADYSLQNIEEHIRYYLNTFKDVEERQMTCMAG